ncbi:MFS transporter [soil metagenome]
MVDTKIPERTLLLLLAAVHFTHIMDFMVMMPLGPQLMRLFHIEPDQFSMLVAVYTFSAAIAGFAGAFFLDRYDRKQALLFCYAGFLLGTLGCALSPDYHTLLIARIVSGAFGGVSGATVLTIVGDIIPPQRRASGFGIVMTSFAVASVVGVPVGLWLAAKWSWHMPFLMIAGLGLFIWLAFWFKFPSLREHLSHVGSKSRQAYDGLKEILTSKNTLTALAFMVMMICGHFIIIPFLSPSMVANAGMKEEELSFIYLAGGIASLLTAPLIGKLADRHGRLKLYVLTILGALAPIYLITHQEPTHLFSILFIAAIFFIFAGGRFIPGQAIIASSVPARLRGSFMSLNSSVRDLASGGASLLGGHIIVKDMATGKLLHYPTLGWIAIGASLLSILIASRVKAVS